MASQSLLPGFIKTLDRITSLRLTKELWVTVQCTVRNSKKTEEYKPIAAGYWRSKDTGDVNFFTDASSSIVLDLKEHKERIMVTETGKYPLIHFLQKSLEVCTMKRYYYYKQGRLMGINFENIDTDGRCEFDGFINCDFPLTSQPVVVKDSTDTKFLPACELALTNQVYVDLTIPQLRTLLEHIKHIDLISFTQNAVNSIGWKLKWLDEVHTRGITDLKLKQRLLKTMDKEEVIGMAKGMDLDVSELYDLTEEEVREAMNEYLKTEIIKHRKGV